MKNTVKSRDAAETAEMIAKMLNILGDKELIAEFVGQMANEHRTLQQGFTRLCVTWLEHLAALNENQYDLRNAASVQLARKIVKATGDKYDRFLPLV